MHKKFSLKRFVAFFAASLLISGVGFVAVEGPANALVGDNSEIDYALSLGAGQAVYAEDTNALDLSANLTLEFWYKVATNDERMILNKENAYEFRITNTGKFSYALQSGGSWDWNDTTVVLPTNEWVHVGYTKSGTTSKVYVNGQLAWSQTAGGTTSNAGVLANPSTIDARTSVLTLGGRAVVNSGTGSLSAQGSGLTLDEVKLWNTTRADSDVAADMHAKATSGAAGLVAYWNFNEGTTSGSAADIYDRSGQSHTLKFSGTPTAANGNFVDVKSTSVSRGRTIVTFPRTYLPGVNGWTVPSNASYANILVVAGGGGGGSAHGGGGGAGAVAVGTVVNLSGIVPITVGQGGLGQSISGLLTCITEKVAYQGQNSAVGSISVSGGGAGANGCNGTQNTTGGSGGGAAYASPDANRGSANIPSNTATVSYFGNAGGYGAVTGSGSTAVHMGGGGGGAGGAGANAAVITSVTAGTGGAGYKSTIGGSEVCYAAGGGGGSGTDQSAVAGLGGTCSGIASSPAGDGSRAQTRAEDASANTGSGGGGGGYEDRADGTNDKLAAAGNGGSGIVIISYASLDDTALDFPGGVDSQYVATNKPVIPSKAPYTFEIWFKADTLRTGIAWNDIFRQQATSSNYSAFGLGIYNGQIQFIHSVADSTEGTLNTAGTTEPLLKISTQQWYHVAISTAYSLSGSSHAYTWRVYVNGNFVKEYTWTTTSATNLGSAELSIGSLYGNTGSRGWDGQLDQLKVWDKALTDAEIKRSMHTYGAADVVDTSGAALRAHYDFNSSDRSSLIDQTGNGHNFTLKSGPNAPSLYQILQTSTPNGKTVYQFERSYLNAWGGWVPTFGTSSATALVVGGGGGGGSRHAGGGGAGELGYYDGLSIATSSVIRVKIGAGGAGFDSATNNTNSSGVSGQSSIFGSDEFLGGGRGQGGTGTVANGGSGGGTAGNSNPGGLAVNGTGSTPSSTLTRYASAGASGNTSGSAWFGGGGGGATGAGVSATTSAAGAGGQGYSSSITGTAKCYAAGGGGGATTSAVGAAGSCTNGASSTASAGTFNTAAVSATTNSGSGGGAGGLNSNDDQPSGAGGSGVAIVSIQTVQTPTFSSHPASVTKSPGETATFSVTSSTADSGTLSYQWEVSANNGANWLTVSAGTGATTSSYTTPALVSADMGKMYRVVVTNTLNGSTVAATSNAATLTMGLGKVNVNFDELNYDFSNVVHVVGANGKALGNKVLFLNVTTKNGIQVDSLVTTEQLSSATIANYESGTGAGGANSYFQVDVDFSAVNGFAKFKFDFYQHGVAGSAGNPCTAANPNCTGATKVILQNVNVSAIDIDYNQWNDFTAAESYTLASNTKLKECPIPISGTCTARSTPGSFPADIRFQGSADYSRTNDPVDMAIVTYADIETFRIKFGKSTSTNPNYYGVAFKALSWGSTTPQTTGGTNYTISYNLNSPSSGTQTVTHTGAAGSLFTVASAGTGVKTGYSFAGWATTANASTVEYAASSKITMPGSNLVLYAVWTPVKYTLTYNANGGTGAPAAGSYDTGTNNVTLASGVPTRPGYVFGGWDTVINSGAGNTNYGSGATYSMPASNTTLYAKWTVANGTLTYNANGGTTTQASVTAAGGSTTTVADRSNTNRSGYDFAGWNSKADGTGTSYAVGSTFTITANVTTTVYAQWTLARYTLVFNVNGGVGTPQSQSYVSGATTTMPVTNPTRDGYNFAGWNSAADGSGTPYNGSFLMPGNNLTLYAKWTPITYSVIYNNNSATYSGAAGTVTDSTAYTAATTVTVRAATGLTNVTGGITYRFIGWNTAANGSGTDYLPADTFSMPAANRTLFAMWVDASIEIAYNANGGTGAPANDNATINSSYTISSATPQRSGYTFDGWNVQDGNPGSGPHTASSSITPNSDEILVAQWTAINYTVSFNSDGGSTTPSTQTSKHVGDTITVDSTAPTKNGYTFLGWKDSNGNIYPAGGTFTMPAGNVTLTAQWQANSYALTYDANSGIGAPGAETRNYNAVANLSATEPTRTGYTFVGWNTLVGGGGSAYSSSASFTMPNTATTLYAQWSVNSFVLAYNTQGGSTAPSSSNKDYNASVTVSSTTPTKTGYTFAGWNTVAAGTGTTYLQSGTFRMPNANVTLYAQWTKTAYTLYYNTNGGQGVFSSQPIKYGESVTVVSTAPTKTGYSFSGWNTAADRSGNDHSANTVFTLNVESNVTLYAKWTAVPYTLEYDANGGSGAPSGGIYTYGASVTTASKGSMNLSGYRFIGWNTRNDGSGSTYIEGATFSMPAENVILYAQWIDSTFEIAYNANGGSGGPDGTSADDGTTYTVDVIRPVRPGYTFGGWKLADGTPTSATLDAATATKSFVVSGNELLVAQWTIKTINVTYDLNGGGGTTPSAQSGDYNTTIVLRTSSGVSRTNYQFVGWSTTPDGSGPTYVDGGSFTLPADDIVLYAKWAPIYYIIEYNPAGGTGEPADQYATPSTTVAIATQEPTKAGYDFEKWTEVQQGTDFAPGSTLTMPTSNVVLVANYTVRAASVPGSGSGSNTSPIDPETKPISQPKKLTLSVYFKGDSPVLTTLAKSHLRKLAAKAKAYGRANNVTIYGRVKETNDKSYDLRLSKARAANVAAYLKKYGVTGVFKVAAKGISPENTFRSRRVDMTLWWSK